MADNLWFNTNIMERMTLALEPVQLIKLEGVSVSGHDVSLARSTPFLQPMYLQIEDLKFTPTQLMVLFLSTKLKYRAKKIAGILNLKTFDVYRHTKRLVELNIGPNGQRLKRSKIFDQADALRLFSSENFNIFEQIFNPPGHSKIKGRAEKMEQYFNF